MKHMNETKRWHRSWTVMVVLLVAVQLGIAYVVGAGEYLKNNDARFFAPIAVTAVVPVAVFVAMYLWSKGFKNMVLSVDITLLTMMQAWRVIGFVFLPFFAAGLLPGVFSWPAGLGDVAIGVVAVAMVWRLHNRPDYRYSSRFIWFNIMGLVDFAVAVITAGLAAGALPYMITNGITSAPLDIWPMNIFPSFFVPVFIIMHACVLLKVSHLKKIKSS